MDGMSAADDRTSELELSWFERALERDRIEDSPLTGRPLPERPRLGRIQLDRYLAALGGPLPYMRRLRRIEDETEAHEQNLATAWRALAAECGGDATAFARRWRTLARAWSLDAINELIERHNRYYPAESRLPMDPRSGDFVLVRGRPYRLEPLDDAWILARFPPDLGRTAGLERPTP
jgi:hypothetical protein